jgi:hypothetical protein
MTKSTRRANRRKTNRIQIDRRLDQKVKKSSFLVHFGKTIITLAIFTAFGFWLSQVAKEMGATSQAVSGAINKGGYAKPVPVTGSKITVSSAQSR